MVRRPLRAAATAVALALAACAAQGEDDRAVQPREPGRCGGAFRAPAGAGLTLAGSFPERMGADARATFEGTVTITNRTQRQVEGLAASRPDVYVTRAGEIVAMPLPRDELGLALDLAPGAARDFAAAGSLRSCSHGRPLPPGRYEVHAVLRVGDIAAVGGPWALEIV